VASDLELGSAGVGDSLSPTTGRRKLRLHVVSDGTHEGTHLVDADTGEELEFDGQVLMNVLHETPEQAWTIPPTMDAKGEQIEPGLAAPPVSKARVAILVDVPVVTPEGTAPFCVQVGL
jgi:hypothetical protein